MLHIFYHNFKKRTKTQSNNHEIPLHTNSQVKQTKKTGRVGGSFGEDQEKLKFSYTTSGNVKGGNHCRK